MARAAGPESSRTTPSGFVKFIVNNNEYSLVETLTAYDNAVTTHAEVSDYLNLSTSSTVDFSVRFLRNFALLDRASPGSGNSTRSLRLIKRLRQAVAAGNRAKPRPSRAQPHGGRGFGGGGRSLGRWWRCCRFFCFS